MIACSKDVENSFQGEEKTNVTVTYTYTGLTDEGNRKNKLAIEKIYANNLKDWEKAINRYLETGQQLVES